MNNQADQQLTIQHMTCPFCGLLCDDLSLVERNGSKLSDNACDNAQSAFAAAISQDTPSPRNQGMECSHDVALASARDLLHQSRRPLISGHFGDLLDARAALRLAQVTDGVFDHAQSDGLMDSLSILQTDGWIVTSLGEAMNRADLWVFIGPGFNGPMPRLLSRITSHPGLHLKPEQPRQAITLATDLDPTELKAAGFKQPSLFEWSSEQLLDNIGVLRATLKKQPLQATEGQDFHLLQNAIEQADYPVFVLSPGAWQQPDSNLIYRSLAALVRELNERSRAAMLPLSASASLTTAQLSAAWQTGFGIRTSFNNGDAHFEPDLNHGSALLEKGEVDLLVWISTLTPEPPPDTDCPVLVFGHPATVFEKSPDLFVPLAVPGIHRAGAIHRGDGLALLPLQQALDNSLPTSDAWFSTLLKRLEGATPSC